MMKMMICLQGFIFSVSVCVCIYIYIGVCVYNFPGCIYILT